MTFVIVSNRAKDAGYEYALRVREHLVSLTGVLPQIHDYARHFQQRGGDLIEKLPEDAVVIVLGGDGTILHVAKRAALFRIPVLGVNVGRIGFLAGIEADELQSLVRLCRGEFRIDERMMLEVRCGGKIYHALNDAVLAKGVVSGLMEILLLSNGRFVSKYRADGIIVTTPTGSTAYSLSAGGPIVDPSLECFGVTPICPFSLVSRSIFFSPGNVLTAKAAVSKENPANLIIDGQQVVPLSPGQAVEIRKSAARARLIRLKDVTFYESLTNKLAGN